MVIIFGMATYGSYIKTLLDPEDFRKGSTHLPETVFAKFRKNFCLKVVLKSSLPTCFLT
eukprot:UN14542